MAEPVGKGERRMSDTKLAILRRSALFAETDETILARVASTCTLQTTKRGTNLFFAGDDPDGVRIVVSGLVRVWINDAEGRELTLKLYEAGDSFGEIALLDGEARSANATVHESGEVLMLGRAAFEDLLSSDLTLARSLITALCGMLRRTNDEIHGFAFQGLGARLAGKLYELAQDHAEPSGAGAVFRRKFSQSDLAHMLGATREAVNKRMSVLTTDGVIRTEQGLVHIPDLAALAAWAERQGRE